MHISFLKKCLARKKSLFTILGGAFFCIALVSCNNFLKGAETRKQLEDSIAYANAKACTLYLKSNPAMGSFLAEGGKEFRVGFATDIQFTLKKNDYYFVSLEAVSVNDEEQSRASYVEFTLDEKASDPDKGIYITKVKLLKETNDIQIRPKCIELPCIKSYSPSGILPNPANTLLVPGDFDHSVTGEKSQKVTRENDQKSHLTPLIIRFPEDCQKQFLPFL